MELIVSAVFRKGKSKFVCSGFPFMVRKIIGVGFMKVGGGSLIFLTLGGLG